jgi:uncharacterized membrane protein YkvI
MTRWIRIYLVPGAVMQSVMIGGAYGTGREVTEFFTRFGMGGGLYGLCVAMALISTIFALSLAVAQTFGAYDYRRFAKVLLGRGWFLYEILAMILVLLVLAVITSASGTLLAEEFGLPDFTGAILVFALVGMLVFFGRSWVTTILSYWSLILYAVFLLYLVSVFIFLDPTAEASAMTVHPGWLRSAFQYTLYNISAIPIVLYAARAIDTRRQALIAGAIGGCIATAPAIMLHLSLAVDYPRIIGEELPVYYLLGLINLPVLSLAYILVLLGTFVETAAGNIQGIIERIDNTLLERRGFALSRGKHALIALGIMITALLLSLAGIVDLVARGYGSVAWGFLFAYAAPLCSVGVYRLLKKSTREPASTA